MKITQQLWISISKELIRKNMETLFKIYQLYIYKEILTLDILMIGIIDKKHNGFFEQIENTEDKQNTAECDAELAGTLWRRWPRLAARVAHTIKAHQKWHKYGQPHNVATALLRSQSRRIKIPCYNHEQQIAVQAYAATKGVPSRLLIDWTTPVMAYETDTYKDNRYYVHFVQKMRIHAHTEPTRYVQLFVCEDFHCKDSMVDKVCKITWSGVRDKDGKWRQGEDTANGLSAIVRHWVRPLWKNAMNTVSENAHLISVKV